MVRVVVNEELKLCEYVKMQEKSRGGGGSGSGRRGGGKGSGWV